MTYLVIVDTTQDNKIAKYQEFNTRQEADNHVAFLEPLGYLNAFVVDNPTPYVLSHTTVDVVAKTITYDSSAYDTQKVKDDAQREINRLEGTVTARRMRDALASDEGKVWVALVEEKIKVERDKL
tara:strand:- start:170 stop:544 length:375 start_codon:yes stop_codon:yes gene_type:complete